MTSKWLSIRCRQSTKAYRYLAFSPERISTFALSGMRTRTFLLALAPPPPLPEGWSEEDDSEEDMSDDSEEDEWQQWVLKQQEQAR